MTISSTIRLFLGIPLDLQMVDNCEAFIAGNPIPQVRWIPSENWHITLIFMGNFPTAAIPRLTGCLKSVAVDCKAFPLVFDNFCYVPNHKAPSMIWQKYQTTEPFEKLVRKLFFGLEDLYAKEGLPFNIKTRDINIPHVTLTRLKSKYLKYPYLKNTEKVTNPLIVSGFVLYASELKSEGAQYTILERFCFE
jgi:RNA 2',3'-cyclic 3'-phosphodiesterase